MVAASGRSSTDDQILERYARHEAALEMGPYQPYRAVLAGSLLALGHELGVELSPNELAGFAGSVVRWPAFDDSTAALAALSDRFRLGVITNCDDDLFSASSAKLGSPFQWVVTAQQVRAYKPSQVPFERALEMIGLPTDRILHVAQSLYHDHVPAQALGLATVWVDRRHDRPGFGATPAAVATPDLTVPDLASLAAMAAA